MFLITILGMESILPTEIARLVYGYLIEENCESAAKLFLETSLHLKECLLVTQKGRRFNTQVSGLNLLDILDKLCEVTCIVKTYIDKSKSETVAENDLLQQLRSLLIPVDEKKSRKKIPELLKNEGVLTESQVSQHNTNLSPLQEKNENIFDGLCQMAFSSQKNSTPEKGNNANDRSGEAILQDSNHQGLQSSPGSTTHTEFSNIEEKGENNMINSSADGFLSSLQQTEMESYNRDIQPIQFNLQNTLSISKIAENKEINVKNNFTPELPHVNSGYATANASNPTSNIPSLNSKNSAAFSAPSLPVAVTELCNRNQSTLTNIRLQLNNNSPKIHVSLLNQHQTVQGNDYLKSSQHPLTATYSLLQPFVGSPTAIYIKPPLKNPIIKNIFTSDNRPAEKQLSVKSSPSVGISNPNDAPVIKISGVRTRGGYIKRGGKYQRRVKAHLPHRSGMPEEKTDLMTRIEQPDDDQPKPYKTEISNVVIPNVIADSNVFQSSVSNGNLGEAQITNTQPDQLQKVIECETTEKKEQITKNLRKRISLSVPRRGSHIRTLDFKTPTKNTILTRRAITSPKQIHASRSASFKKSLRNLRGALFKSPIQKKENKAWDTDLRIYTAESTDIPTSVGLLRRNRKQTVSDQTRCSFAVSPKKSPLSDSSTSAIRSEVPTLKKMETNDDLADKIQKEVLSVIGEEDINFIGENTSLISDSEVHKIFGKDSATPTVVNKNIASNQPESISEQEENPNNSKHDEKKQNSPSKSVINNIFKAEDRTNLLEISNSALLTPVSKVIQEHRKFLESGLLTPSIPLTPNNLCTNETPLKEGATEIPETSMLKLVSPNISLVCQDSLEASLIKECKRIECENLSKSPKEMQKDDINRNSEAIFDKPEKSSTNSNFSNNFNSNANNDSEGTRISPTINQEVESENKNKTLDSDNIKQSNLDISNPFGSQNSPVSPNPNLDISPKLVNSLTEGDTVKNVNGDNVVMNINDSQEQVSVYRKKDSLTVETGGIGETVSVINLNHSILTLQGEKLSSVDSSSKQMLLKTIKSKSEQVKVKKKSKTCPKGNIDCSKLIAQCLRSAKKNLYGQKTKLSSSIEAKPTKIRRKLNSVRIKKHSNNLKSKLARKTSTRIKNINELLTDSSSSASGDSDISECSKQKSELKNYDELHSTAIVHPNIIPSLSSSMNPTIESETNCHSSTLGCVNKEKENILSEENVPKFEHTSLQKRSLSKEKEESSVMSPRFRQKTDSSNKLENYVYTFTLTVDGANVTKQLKVSPFYNIFELETTNKTTSKHNQNKPDKESRSQLDYKDKNRKNKLDNEKETTETPKEGGSKSSFSDDKKYNSNKKYKRDSDPTYKETFLSRTERRRNCRYDELRTNRIRERNYKRDSYLQRFRNEYTPPRFRRYVSPSRNWSDRRNTINRIEPSPKETPKRNSYRPKENLSSESSHRHKKERADANKHEESSTRKNYNFRSRIQFKHEKENSRYSATTYSTKSVQEKKKHKLSLDKEDGELSESSLSLYSLTPALVKTSCERQKVSGNMPPVDEDTRAKLKKVNLDHFLSMLHGTKK
ncbi:uncharacterized protein isoform X3 [Rhodnius prolixus]|uniref:uncharacterized protein isoform X3 n=1 Tax=Rhodnius prolixus TaxID=13249 RepID=UPI003D1878A9